MKQRKQIAKIPQGFEYLNRYVDLFLDEYPHIDRNVFVVMPFSTEASKEIYQAINKSLNDHGLIPLRADKQSFAPALWWNVVTYMIGSSYGVVVYEPTETIAFNPNVSIEAGFMSALDKQVLFLSNGYQKSLPVDFSGHLFKIFSASKIQDSITSAISDWVLHDISYFNYGDKKVVVFVSLGGTCRCVLAKALLSEKLYNLKVSNVVIEAAAVADPAHATISPSGVKALEEINCASWVGKHRPRKLSPYLQERADMLIALTDSSLPRPSTSKATVITDADLFGQAISNPYPDYEDEESLERYRKTRDELNAALDKVLPVILEKVDALPKL